MNYQKEMESIAARPETKGKPLFLHTCCAPCSSHVLTYLREVFRITVFYYNPNITENGEYRKRVEEQKRLVAVLNAERMHNAALAARTFPIQMKEGAYAPERFFEVARGLENCPEGGARCFACYRLRLSEAARDAAAGGFSYFTTSLTISPLKNAAKLNEIGQEEGARYGVAYLPSDFKKKEGYKRSIELSRVYGLYRQEYCGCIYSKQERERKKQESKDDGKDSGQNCE